MQKPQRALSAYRHVQHLHWHLSRKQRRRSPVCEVEPLRKQKTYPEGRDTPAAFGVFILQSGQKLSVSVKPQSIPGQGARKLQKKLRFEPEQLRRYILYGKGILAAV
jgi:hypothetical protein